MLGANYNLQLCLVAVLPWPAQRTGMEGHGTVHGCLSSQRLQVEALFPDNLENNKGS